MNPIDLQGCSVLAVVFGTDTSMRHVRGVAQCGSAEVVISGEDGRMYKVPHEIACSAMRVDDAIRAAAPEAVGQLMQGVDYVVPVPPSDGNFAIARTPGWHARLPKDWKPPADRVE